MPEDETQQRQAGAASQPRAVSAARLSDWRDIFALPQPLKELFSKFPLVTYPANELPLRAFRKRNVHTLHIFTTESGAATGAPSFNPSCLKWQVYLRTRGIEFHTVPSNNHASLTGSLPFLLPSRSSNGPPPSPIPGSKLPRWTREQPNSKPDPEPESLRTEAYNALVDHLLRRAWLYQLYLSPANFEAVAKRLYITPTTTNSFVRVALSHQLRRAAADELLKTSPRIDAAEILDGGKEALSALSTLLGDRDWFFGKKEPGMFDAAVFAYTELLLSEEMGWKENGLGDALRGYASLVEHRKRIRGRYFS